MKMPMALKIAGGLLIVTLVGMFIFENLEPVKIWIPLFKGRRYGLVFIILTAYLLGVFSAIWIMLSVGFKRRKKRKLLELAEEQEQELFEDE